MPKRGCTGQLRARSRAVALPAQVLADTQATATIEFALLFPAYLAVLLAIINTLFIYLAQQGLESTAEVAARLLLTNQAQSFQSYTGTTLQQGMTADQLTKALCGTLSYNATSGATSTTQYGGQAALPPYLSCSNLYVSVTPAASFSAAIAAAATPTLDSSGKLTGTSYSTAYGTTPQRQIMLVQLFYVWPTITGPLGLNLSNTSGSNRILTATQIVDLESDTCIAAGTSGC